MWTISLSISNCFPIGCCQGHITYLHILDSENFRAASRPCIGLVNIFTNGQLLDFTYEDPLGSSPPNFSPNFPKFLGVGANFASATKDRQLFSQKIVYLSQGKGLQNFKNYLNELQEFSTRNFLIFSSRCGTLPLCQNSFTFVPVSYTHLTLPTKRIV